MRAFFAPETERHDPRFFLMRGQVVANEERAERAAALLAGLATAGIAAETPPAEPAGALASVHAPDYLAFLETAWAEWQALPGAGPEVIANVHPPRCTAPQHPGRYPGGVVGRAGWHMADTACPIGPGTWEAARRAADTALAAAEAALAGRDAYALCRPPGHHAYRDLAGGHCFLNNSALAAARLREAHARVAVLDIDVHHGNGTQGIFWERGDILTVSLHADPDRFYPWFSGFAEERGAGAGAGANRNLPLPLGAGDGDWLAALDAAIAHTAAFGPGAVVVALGLDMHEADPLAGLAITSAAIAEAGRRIAALPAPVALVQEGGYPSEALGPNLAGFLRGFLAARRPA
ncbi:MAG: histone deacetylase family protein [Pseudomonadota bacterium]